METMPRVIILVAMVLLTVVSMWTTYVSLNDSILPEPKLNIPLGSERVWPCSVFALSLSVAIGLMLFALKMAIIDEQKHLNTVGVIGLAVIAFISISFNMDVLYRTADKEFFVRYSNDRMRNVYEKYLAEAGAALTKKRDAVRRDLALQEGELQAEIEGLRKAPAGYGPLAKQEDYRLTLLAKTAEVDLQSVEEVLAKKKEADELLRSRTAQSIEDVQTLQNDLRVVIKDVGAQAGIPLPEPVKLESPLFAVFQRLFDFKTVGLKEVFFLLIAIFLDLGDIVGYSLVPNKPKSSKTKWATLTPMPDLPGPEFVAHPALAALEDDGGQPVLEGPEPVEGDAMGGVPESKQSGPRPPRAVRFRRR